MAQEETTLRKDKSLDYDAVSIFERQYVGTVEATKLKLLLPIVRLLAHLGVSPNMMSFAQIPLSVAFVFILAPNPRAAGPLFILIVLLDGIDGALATYSNSTSQFGGMFDPFCDHLREAFIFAALGYYTGLSSFWLAVYVFIHMMFNLATFACNFQETALPFAVKPTLIMYPLLWLYLLLNRPDQLGDAITYGIIISITYMSTIIIQAGIRLHRALSHPASTSVMNHPVREMEMKERHRDKQPVVDG